MVHETGNIPASNGSPSRAASFIDERVHQGADAISGMAHRTAAQIGKAKDYLWAQGGKLKQQGTNLTTTAGQHPVYTMVSAGLIGFGIGFAIRGWRAK
jgi:hypothetical protein